MRKSTIMTFPYLLWEMFDLYFLLGCFCIYEIFPTLDTSVVLVPLLFFLGYRFQGIREQLREVQGNHGFHTSLTSIEQRLTSIEQQVKDVKGDHPYLMVEPTSLADIKRSVMGELASIERKVDKVMEGK